MRCLCLLYALPSMVFTGRVLTVSGRLRGVTYMRSAWAEFVALGLADKSRCTRRCSRARL
jgi:hypothetical protein